VLTDIHQKKPTENERRSSLSLLLICSCLLIELAQTKHSGSALDLQAAFADINIRKSWSVYYWLN
jgi:hypothetical protein